MHLKHPKSIPLQFMEKLSSTKSVLPECQCVWGPVLAFTLVRWELPEGFEKRHEKA